MANGRTDLFGGNFTLNKNINKNIGNSGENTLVDGYNGGAEFNVSPPSEHLD